MELLNHMVVLFLIFWGTSILFSVIAAPVYVPTNSAQGFSVSSPTLAFPIFFDNSLSNKYVAYLSHGGFDLCFPSDLCNVERLFVSVGHQSIQIIYFQLDYLLFFYWVVWVLYVVWVSAFYQMYDLQTFSPIQ